MGVGDAAGVDVAAGAGVSCGVGVVAGVAAAGAVGLGTTLGVAVGWLSGVGVGLAGGVAAAGAGAVVPDPAELVGTLLPAVPVPLADELRGDCAVVAGDGAAADPALCPWPCCGAGVGFAGVGDDAAATAVGGTAVAVLAAGGVAVVLAVADGCGVVAAGVSVGAGVLVAVGADAIAEVVRKVSVQSCCNSCPHRSRAPWRIAIV